MALSRVWMILKVWAISSSALKRSRAGDRELTCRSWGNLALEL
jgi:hypothetical protein